MKGKEPALRTDAEWANFYLERIAKALEQLLWNRYGKPNKPAKPIVPWGHAGKERGDS